MKPSFSVIPIRVRGVGVCGGCMSLHSVRVGLFTSTLWAPPQGIAQSIGIGAPGHDFQLVPLLVGLMGHMMNSIVLGAFFIAIARAIRLQGIPAVAGGMIYGVIVYAAMYWLLLRGVLSSTSASFLSSNPEWSWVAAHLMFGFVLGALAAYGPLRTLYGQAARPTLAAKQRLERRGRLQADPVFCAPVRSKTAQRFVPGRSASAASAGRSGRLVFRPINKGDGHASIADDGRTVRLIAKGA